MALRWCDTADFAATKRILSQMQGTKAFAGTSRSAARWAIRLALFQQIQMQGVLK